MRLRRARTRLCAMHTPDITLLHNTREGTRYLSRSGSYHDLLLVSYKLDPAHAKLALRLAARKQQRQTANNEDIRQKAPENMDEHAYHLLLLNRWNIAKKFPPLERGAYVSGLCLENVKTTILSLHEVAGAETKLSEKEQGRESVESGVQTVIVMFAQNIPTSLVRRLASYLLFSLSCFVCHVVAG